MPVAWTHVVLKVSDLERSIAFYRRFCGLDVVRDGRGRGSHTVWMAPAPRPGEGAPARGSPPRGRDPAALPGFVLVLYQHEIDFRLDHLGFQCDSREEVDRIAAEAARLGALAQPPFDGGGDIGYVTQIRDPDGHVVEFTHGQPIAGLRG
jgi:catechol 2,3-dioxygenase-like lactoylglutathione lyase family enzyme